MQHHQQRMLLHHPISSSYHTSVCTPRGCGPSYPLMKSRAPLSSKPFLSAQFLHRFLDDGLDITQVLTKSSSHSEHLMSLVLFQYTTFLRVILYLGRMYSTIKICKCMWCWTEYTVSSFLHRWSAVPTSASFHYLFNCCWCIELCKCLWIIPSHIWYKGRIECCPSEPFDCCRMTDWMYRSFSPIVPFFTLLVLDFWVNLTNFLIELSKIPWILCLERPWL